MGRIVAVVLALGITSFAAYFYVKGQAGASAEGKSAPKQTLDNVRVKAKSIEDDAQQRADDLAKKTMPE